MEGDDISHAIDATFRLVSSCRAINEEPRPRGSASGSSGDHSGLGVVVKRQMSGFVFGRRVGQPGSQRAETVVRFKAENTRTGAQDKKEPGRPASILALALPAPPFQMTSCCPSSFLPRQIRFIFISGSSFIRGGLETKISARHVALLNTKATRSKWIGGK